jgi:hypothetical protein
LDLADLRVSLRLYDAQEHLVAQQDEAPRPPVQEWSTSTLVTLPLALPIPVALPPGAYTVRLLLYDGATGQPVTMAWDNDTIPGLLDLGQITLATSAQIPEITTRLARFDYIDLVYAALWPSSATIADALSLDLVWQPQISPYQDTYVARWLLMDEAGSVRQTWEDALGGWAYPSGSWAPQIPVRQRVDLPLSSPLHPGKYTVQMELFRPSDGEPISADLGWWRIQKRLSLGSFEVH